MFHNFALLSFYTIRIILSYNRLLEQMDDHEGNTDRNDRSDEA